jgi:hypothetical protein
MPPYIPYFNGGAPGWGTYLYNEEYPEFDDSSQETFASACRNRDVRFVLLTSFCSQRALALGDLFNMRYNENEFTFLVEIDRFRIFEVRGK